MTPHRLIDSHAHLTYPGLADRIDEVLAAASAAGVQRIITIGASVSEAEKAIALARAHDQVHATAGIHPHEAAKVSPADLDRIVQLAADPAVVAIGELGLDYHYDFADRSVQRGVFVGQLERFQGTHLPLVIHCREAFDDCIAILVEHGFAAHAVVVHCFTGTRGEAARVAEQGWRISFTGIVTFKNSLELQAIARDYPADQLMLETDAPFLSPEPVRKIRTNEPAHVRHTAAFLARLRGQEAAELAEQTTANTIRFFNLPA